MASHPEHATGKRSHSPECTMSPSHSDAERTAAKSRKLAESTDPCSICMTESIEAIDIASLDCCIHTFCFDCIRQWTSDIASTCPICVQQVSSITRHNGQAVESVLPRQQCAFYDEDDHYSEDEYSDTDDSSASDWCWRCEFNVGDAEGNFLPCRGPCGQSYHALCTPHEDGATDLVCSECIGTICAHCERPFSESDLLTCIWCPSQDCLRSMHSTCIVKLPILDTRTGIERYYIVPCQSCLERASEAKDEDEDEDEDEHKHLEGGAAWLLARQQRQENTEEEKALDIEEQAAIRDEDAAFYTASFQTAEFETDREAADSSNEAYDCSDDEDDAEDELDLSPHESDDDDAYQLRRNRQASLLDKDLVREQRTQEGREADWSGDEQERNEDGDYPEADESDGHGQDIHWEEDLQRHRFDLYGF